MLNTKKTRYFSIFLIIIIVLFLASFEFYHTDRILEKDDNCPIGIFEKNSVLFIDYSILVLFVLLFILLFKISIDFQIYERFYFKNSNLKRAPPIFSNH